MKSSDGLRKRKPGNQDKWTLEELRNGFEYFKSIYGKYPGSREIDLFDFLPSSRSLQRSFNGLVNLRKLIGLDDSLIDQTKGMLRSKKAKDTYANSIDYESRFYGYLISKIPEVQVHEHKILRPGNVCCDFFIYTSAKEGYAIDIFYAQDLFTLQRIIRIKYLRYKNLSCKVYFVLVGNDFITQEEINALIDNRKIKIPSHISVLTERCFKQRLI